MKITVTALLLVSFFSQGSEKCTDCHVSEFTNLQSSKHWESVKIFAIQQNKIESCVSCHAPYVEVTGDITDVSEKGAAKYGINCKSCHFTRTVRKDAGLPVFIFEPGLFVFSTHTSRPARRAHGIFLWSENTKDELCRACHFYTKGQVVIMDRYSDRVRCQTCHGMHTLRVGTGIKVSLSCFFKNNTLEYSFTLKNTTGHFIPSGLPGGWFQVILEDSRGNIIWKERLEKIVVDESYRVLKDPEKLFSEAFKIIKDNRLKPHASINKNASVFVKVNPVYLELKWTEVNIKGEVRYKGSLTSPCKYPE